MTVPEQFSIFIKGFIPALGLLAVIALIAWIRGIIKQKQRNTINELDLVGKKIEFEVNTESINDLVSDSNKSHGALVDPAGSDPKKE